MLALRDDTLEFRFDDVHPQAVCSIRMVRTLRIPDDNRDYPLPPGLGRFPLRHVDDYTVRLPAEWSRHGGVLLPMHQAEAMWLRFSTRSGYPFAIKIAAGKINAVTGTPWRNALSEKEQDYMVAPAQPWLDGFCVGKGLVRQFVAMPLGQGHTAEEQLTGAAEHGGLQIVVCPMRREVYDRLFPPRTDHDMLEVPMFSRRTRAPTLSAVTEDALGLAPGGLMRQTIEVDDYGVGVWDQARGLRCFVHLLNGRQWQAATGEPPPGKPPTAADYTRAGLPWFEHYGEGESLAGSSVLANLDSVAAKVIKQDGAPLADNEAVNPVKVVKLGATNAVADGDW